ncbi:hypothetical protein OG607_34085 [Streptomyces sp. NBC_01537]|uniref:hypothetical protein n=1 Tax=Streptomyces sp. NBC_01537 TaxID=2903896 RepID=UPI00386F4879
MTTTVAAEEREQGQERQREREPDRQREPEGSRTHSAAPGATPPRRKSRFRLGGGPGARTTPARLRLLRAAAVATALALIGVLIAGGVSANGSWSGIRERSAPQVTSATGLYFALNDMDAQLANQLMTGNTASLSAHHADAVRLYAQRRSQAGGFLRDLAEAAQGDHAAERSVAAAITDLGRYEELAARALLLGEQTHRTEAVTAYDSATALMRTRLLPEADRLVTANNLAFERTYADTTGAQSAIRVALIATGLLLLALLALLQFFLASRFRRVINPGAAAATVLVLAAMVAGLVHISSQQGDLTTARRDAFDSVLALTRARAVSYDANADESRYLLDRTGAATAAHERDFLAKSRRLVRLEPSTTLSNYDSGLAAAIRAYRADPTDLRFTGYLGDEFRNITFPGERAAAERVLTTYQAYQRDDRTIRSLASSGRLAEAIAYCTSYAKGDSNYAFGQYDQALQALIAINMSAYEAASSDGAAGALTVPLGASGAVLAAAGLMVLGLRPRLAEFR